MRNYIKQIKKFRESKSFSICLAESCTGGMISSKLTSISGSSAFFEGSVVSYSNNLKNHLLKVPKSVINKYGAVSEETARAMAKAACSYFGSSCGIGITGVAGPDNQPGENAEPGTVFIAVAHPKGVEVRKYKFPPRRTLVRGRAVTQSLLQLAQVLQMNGYINQN